MRRADHTASILVIDDYLLMRKNLESILTLSSYQVHLAACASDALHVLHTTEIDLIITDILLPGIDGLAFYQQVRSRERWRHVPFIFLSGSLSDLGRVRSEVMGEGARCLPKPFAVQSLLDMVSQALTPACTG